MSLSESLKRANQEDNAPHLIVQALAGTGKTTTLVEGLKIIKNLPSEIKPSEQQLDIWAEMLLSDPKTVCFVAFNKSIASELQERVPDGCDAMTMHSLGFRAVRKRFPDVKVSSFRVRDIIAELMGCDIFELKKKQFELMRATEKLVSLCKMNLVDRIDWFRGDECTGFDYVYWEQCLAALASYYDIDLNGNQQEIFDLVPQVLEKCKDVDKCGCVDFNDMIWLPVVLDLPVFKYDLLLVDECQDLNRCQQQLALKSGKRLILVGDSHQAVYGFAGADSESMKRMEEILKGKCIECGGVGFTQRVCDDGDGHTDIFNDPCEACNGEKYMGRGCVTLPLTVTRRCGKAIVEEAQKIVPEFEAHKNNCKGKILYADLLQRDTQPSPGMERACYTWMAKDGDMVLCRVNAPLVSECFKFLKAGRKANIIGRDVGQGLISTINRLVKNFKIPMSNMNEGELQLIHLHDKLDEWLEKETKKERAKQNPSDGRLIALQDRHDCILCFMQDVKSVDEVIKKIESIFSDERNGEGIKLSSGHKAKGLEAKRVFILRPEGSGCPHPMAKSGWQIEQEWNLLYVMQTRAIEELVYVS